MRQHPSVLGLPFKVVADGGPKKQERVNARVAFIEGEMTELEQTAWDTQLAEGAEVAALDSGAKAEFMKSLSQVALSSDAFFPFRDSIDVASKRGVTYIAQPGGSVQDVGVTAACNDYGMTMALSGLRQFHH